MNENKQLSISRKVGRANETLLDARHEIMKSEGADSKAYKAIDTVINSLNTFTSSHPTLSISRQEREKMLADRKATKPAKK